MILVKLIKKFNILLPTLPTSPPPPQLFSPRQEILACIVWSVHAMGMFAVPTFFKRAKLIGDQGLPKVLICNLTRDG